MKNPFLFFVLSLFSLCLHAQTTISSSVSFTQSDADTYSWPITINGGTISSPVVITLVEDILLEQVNKYFIIESEYVVFNGDYYTVTIDNVPDYPGLLQNGSNSVDGYSYVTVNDTRVHSSNSTLLVEGGWIGQSDFAHNSTDVVINNCFSDGDISNFGGGITGVSSSCTVTNSHSSGQIGQSAGGIFGAFSAGTANHCHSAGSGNLYSGGILGGYSPGVASNCFSTGIIADYGGGIIGYAAAGSATSCYSTGNISSFGGGIAGPSYTGTIGDCYSTGDISSDAGGITGADNSGSVTNCYSTGVISAGGGGIGGTNDTGTPISCYAADGNWIDADANTYLTNVGSIWAVVSGNIPYKLSSFNESIYSPDNANVSGSTSSDFFTGNFTTGTYSIIGLTGNPAGYSSLTINSSTGMVSVNNSVTGSYVLKILYSDNSDGSYQINNFTLDVLSTLPLTWRSFSATLRGNTSWLQWSTASEQNTRDFNVQHSINGSNWSAIGTITAAGNSTSISNYSFLHADPVTGNNFYRIQQTDMDGKYNYSSIKQLQITLTSKSFSVLNTTVSNGVLQVVAKAPVLLYLYGNEGKLYWQKQFSAGLQNIDLNNVPKGIYFLKSKDAVEKIVVR